MTTIVSGTNRADSATLKVAKFYQNRLSQLGHSSDLLNLETLPPNFLFSDLYGDRSDAFRPIEELIFRTTKFVFVLPEYNGSFPGVVKALIDSMDPGKAFAGKKAALVGVSDGKFGNLRGLEHFTGVLNYVKAQVLPFKAHLMKIGDKLDANGQVADPDSILELERQMALFVQF